MKLERSSIYAIFRRNAQQLRFIYGEMPVEHLCLRVVGPPVSGKLVIRGQDLIGAGYMYPRLAKATPVD